MKYTFPNSCRLGVKVSQALPNVGALSFAAQSMGDKDQIHYGDCKRMHELFDKAMKEIDGCMLALNGQGLPDMFVNARQATNVPSGVLHGSGSVYAGKITKEDLKKPTVLMTDIFRHFIEPLLTMKKYAFYPFRLEECGGKEDDVSQGLKNSGQEIFIRYNGEKTLKDIPLLSQIYVCGHGGPGLSYLVSDSKDQVPLKYDRLRDRIFASGLKEEFWGRIKIFACSAGARTDVQSSFTERFAAEMRGTGYTNCEYFGYEKDLRLLSSKVGNHKYTNTDPDDKMTDNWDSYCSSVIKKALTKFRMGYRCDGISLEAIPEGFAEMEEAVFLAQQEENLRRGRGAWNEKWFEKHEERASKVRKQF